MIHRQRFFFIQPPKKKPPKKCRCFLALFVDDTCGTSLSD